MRENTNAFREAIIKNGLILGIIHTILFLVFYAIDPGLSIGLIYVLIVITLNIIYTSITGRNYRNASQSDGYISFGKAFKYGLFVLSISGIISLLLTIVVNLTIFTDMNQLLAEAQVQNSIDIARFFGASEPAIDEMRDKMDIAELENKFSPLERLKSIWIALIFWAIGGVIVGFIVRKQMPIEA